MQLDDSDPPIDLTDEPISLPAEDTLGLKTIARTLATSIRKMKMNQGVVLGINGSWGTGKTSLIKLVEHYVEEDEKNTKVKIVTCLINLVKRYAKEKWKRKKEDGKRKKKGAKKTEVKIVHFHCWWFNNEEALILNFLQTLHAPLDKKSRKKAKKLFLELVKSGALQASGEIVLNITTGGGIQIFVSILHLLTKVWKFISNKKENKSKEEKKSMDSLFQALSIQLAKRKKRYLVVIDDIDRLSAAEMTMMFRLVKTLGHLPNVVYLLAFDRALAEQALSKVYPGRDKTPDKTPNSNAYQSPSNDPSFLEKIVQSFINIPVPSAELLGRLVENEVMRILRDAFPLAGEGGKPSPLDAILAICHAYIHTPRDFKRYKNALLTTYPAVQGKVHAMDYLVMEAWRIFEPDLHAYIESECPFHDMNLVLRALPDLIKSELESFPNDLLHNKIPQARKGSFEHIVLDMFPSKEEKDYIDKKRIASIEHFKTYFYWSAEVAPPPWKDFLEKTE